VSDRRDRHPARPGPRVTARRAALLAAALCTSCETLGPAEPPPAGGGGTPCTRATAIAAAAVVVVAGSCNPWCIHVAAGARVEFLNQDPATYLFASEGPPPFEMLIPASSAASTPPLASPGTVVVTAVHAPAATATIFVE
jgi:hypothetical protein